MKQNKKIIVSAPGKLMLLGEHAVVYNHPCLVTAVDQRMRATVETLDTLEFQLDAEDVKVTGYRKPLSELGVGDIPKGAKFVEIALKNINEKYPLKSGIRITTKSEFSSQFGFGSSSASTVCTVKAVSELLNLNFSNKEIFDLSYKTVLDIQGKGSGFDVAAAVYGGTLYFVTGGKVIEPLSIKSLPLIVGYSGIKADTVVLMNKVKESFANRQDRLNEIYSSIEALVNNAEEALLRGNLEIFGELMNKIIFLSLSLIMFGSFSYSQNIYDFLRLDGSARAGALGGSFVSNNDDADVIFYNPAGIELLEGNPASFSFVKHLLDINNTEFNNLIDTFQKIYERNTNKIGSLVAILKGRENIYKHLGFLFKDAKKDIVLAVEPEAEEHLNITNKTTGETKIITTSPSKGLRMCVMGDVNSIIFPISKEEVHPDYDLCIWIKNKHTTKFLKQLLESA